MSDKVSWLGDRGKGVDPRLMLEGVLKNHEDIEAVAIVVKYKDGDKSAHSSSNDRWWIWAASGILASFALEGEGT